MCVWECLDSLSLGFWLGLGWVGLALFGLDCLLFSFFASYCSLQGPPFTVVAYHWPTLLLLLMLAAVAFIDYSTVQVQAHYRPAVQDVGGLIGVVKFN